MGPTTPTLFPLLILASHKIRIKKKKLWAPLYYHQSLLVRHSPQPTLHNLSEIIGLTSLLSFQLMIYATTHNF